MLDPEGRALRDDLVALIRRGARIRLPDDELDAWAHRVFSYAFDHVPAYAGYSRARGIGRAGPASWREVPAVPTAAFKELRLLAAGASAEAVFRTSGTTRGPERRGEHHVADLAVYRESLRAAFAAALLPDGARLRFLSLMPPPDALPDSSLAFMIGDAMAHFGASSGGAYASAAGLDRGRLEAAVARATDEDAPVLLLGTSAAFIHWLDALALEGLSLRLPEGSRLMDTGGFKGGGREVSPTALRAAYQERLGIPPRWCINEYGMTEMLSQLYDDPVPADPRPKIGPSWTRSLAVDPETLAPLPPGRTGLLRHIDLANFASVPGIQTEDLGRVDARGGVVLEGRASGAPPRGCSIAMDLLLREAG